MSLVALFPRVAATLRTFGASVNTDGEWASGTSTDTTIMVIKKQPAVGAELLWLPEGDRARAHFFTWAVGEIDIHDSTERQDPDQIIYGGQGYLVVKAQYYEEDDHTEILMRELAGVTA